ncbi:hypothetical protein CL176_01410 [Suicoccus acidiformans]|uniref:Uncharacterized protein n=1 Tax=Suicoccus acidiformans TaxID=2036206 RepID=A0A347WI72_9LACT|nr:hypothetical protein [Suicoccus acidiformans]AXY24779.1 hypothetical protein CL176_01410 [Suicoccus acidiformans]
MRTTKLVIGIISIILAVFIMFQSSIAGLGNTLMDNGEISGSAGMLLAICYLVSGILGIVGRTGGMAGHVAGVFYIVGGILALPNAGTYSDLIVWGWLGIIFGIVFIIGTRKQNKGV